MSDERMKVNEDYSNSRVLTIKEAAIALGVSRDTVRRRIKDGILPAQLLPSSSGNKYYIRESDLAEVAEIKEVTPIHRQADLKSLERVMRGVVSPLFDEIRELREEVAELHKTKDVIMLNTPSTKTPWKNRKVLANLWKKIISG